MRKIHFKITGLVLVCLIVLGASLGVVGMMELSLLGRENLATLDHNLRRDFDRMSESQVQSALGIITHFYERKNELGEEQAKELARRAVIAMRYGEDSYIFILDSRGTLVARLGGSDEGQIKWDAKDAAGDYYIRNIIAAAKSGEGVVEYWHTRPGAAEASPKRSYSAYFAPWDWIVGTGNYADDIDARIDAERAVIDKAVKDTVLIIILSDLAVMFLAVLLSWFVGKRISRPVEYLALEARKVAEGDLNVQIKVDARDETGELAAAMGDMVGKLNQVVFGIIGAAEQINRSAGDISAASQQVASGASEQASSAEEISASMEQLNSNIQQNSENSRQSKMMVGEAAKDAETGGEAVENTVNSMNFISEKIGVIEEIARNTNLLALNAAIEAARAGEAGKGFAVVAAEIRKLAETSQNAAKDITQVAGESVERAEETRQVIRSIIPAIRQSAEIAEEIMLGSSEQANGAEQVNSALLQMDQVIQSNASASEEIAGMAGEMKEQSDRLSRLIGFFKLRSAERRETLPRENGKAPELNLLEIFS